MTTPQGPEEGTVTAVWHEEPPDWIQEGIGDSAAAGEAVGSRPPRPRRIGAGVLALVLAAGAASVAAGLAGAL